MPLSDFEKTDAPNNGVIETVIKNTSQCSVTLTKNTKGYGWEVKAHADTMAQAIDLAICADNRLKNIYGGSQ